jgi:hypothetical protein
MYEDILNLVCLLDLDADPHTVYTWLNEHPLILISRNCQRVQKHFRRGLRFDLRDVVPF